MTSNKIEIIYCQNNRPLPTGIQRKWDDGGKEKKKTHAQKKKALVGLNPGQSLTSCVPDQKDISELPNV